MVIVLDDFEILDTLRANAKNNIVYEFTKELFFKELREERSWRSDYQKLIDEFAKKGD